MIEVLKIKRPGPALSFQDAGRFGMARYGVPPSGYMDPLCAKKALRLLNRPAGECLLEVGLGGSLLEVLSPCWLSHVGGLHCPQLPSGSACYVNAGTRLEFAPGPAMWSYLAINGEFDAPARLGSRSHHPTAFPDLSFVSDQMISAKLPPQSATRIHKKQLITSEMPDLKPPRLCEVEPGPHFESFDGQSLSDLFRSSWQLSPLSNRTGYRLEGPKLHSPIEIKSMPTFPGCIQIPPSGQPIVTLHDGPTVGGYPIIAIIPPDELRHLTQARPGESIHFNLKNASPD